MEAELKVLSSVEALSGPVRQTSIRTDMDVADPALQQEDKQDILRDLFQHYFIKKSLGKIR